jgi:hypothetical protein
MNHPDGLAVQPRADTFELPRGDGMPAPKAFIPKDHCHCQCPGCPCGACRSLLAATGGGLTTHTTGGHPKTHARIKTERLTGQALFRPYCRRSRAVG